MPLKETQVWLISFIPYRAHIHDCYSVVTSVNHTSTRSKRNSHSPCSRCEHGVNKSELSFDFRWFYLNGTTPHATLESLLSGSVDYLECTDDLV